jgi:hypothetical protein
MPRDRMCNLQAVKLALCLHRHFEASAARRSAHSLQVEDNLVLENITDDRELGMAEPIQRVVPPPPPPLMRCSLPALMLCLATAGSQRWFVAASACLLKEQKRKDWRPCRGFAVTPAVHALFGCHTSALTRQGRLRNEVSDSPKRSQTQR